MARKGKVHDMKCKYGVPEGKVPILYVVVAETQADKAGAPITKIQPGGKFRPSGTTSEKKLKG